MSLYIKRVKDGNDVQIGNNIKQAADFKEKAGNVKKRVYDRLDLSVDTTDDSLRQMISECVYDESRSSLISLKEREKIAETVFNAIRKLDILQELLEDDSITEIMINGPDDIFLERNGRLERWNKSFETTQKLEDIAQKIAAMSNRIVNSSVPIADTRLEDGSRVSIVLPPVALNGPVITIRKFYSKPLTMEKLIELKSISEEAAMFLKCAVCAKYNIFISGGTGSGKTTFLNVLSNYIPKDERIITIEDSAELQIRNVENIVRLEARSANVEGKNEVSIRALIKASLRMRPDRIVVGEVRGAEALDMLQAMSTGHDGSLSTGHGNTPQDMMTRLETMVVMGIDMPVIAIRQQIASAIDIIVHLGRLRDKTRRVIKIVELVGLENSQIKFNTLFEFKEFGTDTQYAEARDEEVSSRQAEAEQIGAAQAEKKDGKLIEAGQGLKADNRVCGRLVKVGKGIVNTEKMQSARIKGYW